jgi:septal ring factor EnvC (AmiA/AmiB activator)
MPVDGPISNSGGGQENIRIVDDDVFLSIVNRLEDVEKKSDSPVVQNSVPAQVTEGINELTREVKMTKDLLLQTQIFNMKTDQRISQLEETIAALLARQPVADEDLQHETLEA